MYQILLLAALVVGEPSLWLQYTSKAIRFRNDGQLPEAVQMYKAAAEAASEPQERALSLNSLGLAYFEQHNYPAAEHACRDALALFEQSPNEQNNAAAAMTNLAAVYAAEGRLSDAEPLYLRAVSIREQVFGKDAAQLAAPLNDLADLYRVKGDVARAEANYVRAFDLWRKVPPSPHDQTFLLRSRNNLAVIYVDTGRLSDAERLLKETLGMENELFGESVSSRPETAITEETLAAVYKAQENYADAKPLYRRAISMLRHTMGADSPAVARALQGLGAAYSAQNDYEEAGLQFQQAVDILEKHPGSHGAPLAAALSNLATCLFARKKYDQALPLMERALRLWEAAGPSDPAAAVTRRNYTEMLRRAKRSDPRISAFR